MTPESISGKLIPEGLKLCLPIRLDEPAEGRGPDLREAA
jgi:hypothetical protein